MIVYEAFPYQNLPEDRLKLRFHRISCNVLVRTRKSSAKKNAAKRQKDQAKQNLISQEVTFNLHSFIYLFCFLFFCSHFLYKLIYLMMK